MTLAYFLAGLLLGIAVTQADLWAEVVLTTAFIAATAGLAIGTINALWYGEW